MYSASVWPLNNTNDTADGTWFLYFLFTAARIILVRFEVPMAVTMKNAIFRDVMLCGSCKN
jgi:hypothetical protein